MISFLNSSRNDEFGSYIDMAREDTSYVHIKLFPTKGGGSRLSTWPENI